MSTQSTNVPAYIYFSDNIDWLNLTNDSRFWKLLEKLLEKIVSEIASKDNSSEKVDELTPWQKAAIPRLISTLNYESPTPTATTTPTSGITESKVDGIKGKKDGGIPPDTLKKPKLVDNFLSEIEKTGLWADYSGPDRSFRTKDAKGKVSYDWGAGIMNTVGNLSKYGSMAMSFVKDKETANNTVNDAATSVRKTALLALLSTGNPIAMAIGATSMLSDKVGGTASATKGLGLGNDIGNFLGSQIPFLGFLGRNMGKQFLSDELSGSSMYAWNSTADGLFGGSILFGKGKAKDLTQTNNMLRSLATNILRDAKLDFIGALDPRYYLAAQNELNGGYTQVAKHGAILQFTKRTLSKSKIKKLHGGPIVTLTKDGNFEILLKRTLPYEEWIKLVPKEYLSELYDLKAYYEEAIRLADLGNPELLELLQRWLYAINRPTEEERKFYGDLLIPDENGILYNPYHLGSIIPLYNNDGSETGEYIFLKLGTEDLNPELHWETDEYHSGRNGLNKTHNLSFEGDRYYYRLKNPEKFKEGGKVNVIPDGALHAHKHHLTEKAEDGEKFEDVTTKGIPVVVEDEKGNLIQQAEVEREEIIFRLEVTKKLEELSKKHTDEAAIEAGKLLVQEILHNTIDNTQEMI